jgi:Bacterial SH3 domain
MKLPLFLMLTSLFLVQNTAFAQAKTKKTPKKAKTAVEKTDVKKDKKTAGTSAKPAEIFKPRVAYLMSGQANIRKQPNTKSDVVVRLAAGSELTMLAPANAPYTVDGVKADWYKVAFKRDTTLTEGYVWGGYLSDSDIESARDKGTQFLLRRNSDTAILVQATFNGNLLSAITVPTKGCKGAKARTRAGWDNIHDAIIINSACKDFAYEDLLIWTGKKLYFVGSTKSNAKLGSDPFQEEHWIIDPEKGAKRDAVLKEKTDRIEWDGTIYRNAQSAMQRFEWNGTQLIEK